MIIGHATMYVRYHAGGYDPQTVVPGQQITMMMEFQGIDALLPAGHGLRFIFSDQGEDYLAPACGSACTVHILPSLSVFEAPPSKGPRRQPSQCPSLSRFMSEGPEATPCRCHVGPWSKWDSPFAVSPAMHPM